jgi:NADH:ubiquinone oxidoreductase subunit 2 (subunit N)
LVLAAGAAVVAVALSVDAGAGHRRETEFVMLLQLGVLGAILLGGADDLLLLFAAFLLACLPFCRGHCRAHQHGDAEEWAGHSST